MTLISNAIAYLFHYPLDRNQVVQGEESMEVGGPQ